MPKHFYQNSPFLFLHILVIRKEISNKITSFLLLVFWIPFSVLIKQSSLSVFPTVWSKERRHPVDNLRRESGQGHERDSRGHRWNALHSGQLQRSQQVGSTRSCVTWETEELILWFIPSSSVIPTKYLVLRMSFLWSLWKKKKFHYF